MTTEREQILALSKSKLVASEDTPGMYVGNEVAVEAFYHAARKDLEHQLTHANELQAQSDKAIADLTEGYDKLEREVELMKAEFEIQYGFRAKAESERDELRQQLAEKDEQLSGWLTENSPGGWIDGLRQLVVNQKEYYEQVMQDGRNRIKTLLEQLAAAQAQIVGYREALENHGGNYKLSKAECAKVNALLDQPADTSALEAIVEKAGEVMRERAAAEAFAYGCAGRTIQETKNAIRALPGVKLEDLQG